MKEIYLAMDRNLRVFGFEVKPVLSNNGYWLSEFGSLSLFKLAKMGIDVTKFPLTHETPIKIRAVWEVINE